MRYVMAVEEDGTVWIADGSYAGAVTVSKRLDIRGDGSVATTTIAGPFSVTASGSTLTFLLQNTSASSSSSGAYVLLTGLGFNLPTGLTIGSGTAILPPWILVSHLVTRRQIPFDIPMVESPTSDNVRATVDMLVTFTITDVYRFIYSISADDFDQVFMAACQDALRLKVRQVSRNPSAVRRRRGKALSRASSPPSIACDV